MQALHEHETGAVVTPDTNPRTRATRQQESAVAPSPPQRLLMLAGGLSVRGIAPHPGERR
jgi:hypothetical protein